ncbi:MAG: AraC family transcriptional regulator [Calditrichaeota bacterium]|nr:MAG: AraC family transcriptional regulator [Calditrichota bacterium]MBL1206313.1 AraC family transcriptional regulator [Calditrichota bacterium]NOG46139.1 helix-turn-helix transcriptional regulator [Calditrichota bacterium]
MYKGLIVTQDDKIRQEIASLLNTVGEIKGDFVNSLDEVNKNGAYLDYLFILVSDLNHQTIKSISNTQLYTPDLSTIFYNHSLNYVEIPEIARTSKVKMIIGENRKSNLSELFVQLKNDFWRKIPYEELGIKYDLLSKRMKEAMDYIETAPIRDCNIIAISDYLNISAGYFSQEFKRETNLSFRSFMQTVLNYYEDIIFTKVNLPAKDISMLLGYSELSSFSRSFKKRKGVSPTKYRKLLQA